ncbi:WD and tetratricopeptide repeats protein 1 isoform X2 [Leptinotarsa decemlineata]
MGDKLRKWRYRRDFLKLLHSRENNAEASKFLKMHSQFTDNLVKRLGLEYELEGHQGCVNCLEWTADGKYLASGSDDTNIILWDPFRHKKLQVIPTNHIGNIFSVKFLGRTCTELATASGDCRVLVQSINDAVTKGPPILECSCHVNRVKRLAISPIEPSLFWSAAEDGLVIQYDLREPHECTMTNTKVLLDLSSNFGEVKCIAVNPTKPHYIAVGVNDCYIRLYDRRMLKPSTVTFRQERVHFAPRFQVNNIEPSPENEPVDPNCVQYYAPGHLAIENARATSFKLAATNVSFNSAGSEMLVNMGGEQIYLFDINKSRQISDLQIPRCSPKKEESVTCKNCAQDENGFVGKPNMKYISEENCACFYLEKANEFLGRKWIGDLYNAARNFLHVIQYWPSKIQAYTGLIESLIELKWIEEAKKWIEYFSTLHTNNNSHPQVTLLRTKLEKLEHANLTKEEGKDASDDKDRLPRRVDDAEYKKRLESKDFEVRFLGHCNTTTDIKEANFLGEDGNYVCAGSDEGIIFVWERKRSKIVTALFGDLSIVNCIQPHPSMCFIASSGIDSSVKLWSPLPEDDCVNPRAVTDIQAVVEANQQRMSMDPYESMMVNLGYSIYGRSVDQVQSEVVPPCRTC